MRSLEEKRRANYEAVQRYKANHPVSYHRKIRLRARLRRVYDISLQQFVDTLRLQDGKCPICEVPLTWENYTTDHDHETHVFRGILCNDCNLGIGRLQDDVALLRRAIRYLGGDS